MSPRRSGHGARVVPRKWREVIDHVLALLPFEPPYMAAAGMSCDFVGHPVVAEPVADDVRGAAFRLSMTSPPMPP